MYGAKRDKLWWLIGLAGLLSACAKASTPTEPPPVQIPAAAHQEPARQPLDNTQPWVLVDTKAKILKVMIGNATLDTFTNVAFGSSGVGIKRYRGDHKTPLGVFRIGWMNERSRFNLFFGLDYPNLDYAERAYRDKLIDASTYYVIRRAVEEGRTPPQNTSLGGSIGIHGLGAGSLQIHSNFDWTDGCIALDNRQILRLAYWVRVGTQVEIR